MTTGSVCSIHSAGVEIGGAAIALVGESGVGKTTLALALALSGARLLGDEFAYLNLDTGCYHHADYPICLKPGTKETLGLISYLTFGVDMTSPWGVSSKAYPLKKMLAVLGRASGKAGGIRSPFVSIPVRALVFPRWDDRAEEAYIEQVLIAELPNMLMPSIICNGSRIALFKRFIALLSEQGIVLLSIRYKDAFSCVHKLLRYYKDLFFEG